MQCRVEHGIDCLPVTALHVIEHAQVTLILANSGSSIFVQSDIDEISRIQHQVFESQNIHGIISHPIEQNDSTATYYVIVWGGSEICFCTLKFDTFGGDTGPSNTELAIGEARKVNDWIMTVTINSFDLSVVFLTAHNAIWSFDLSSGTEALPKLLTSGPSTLLYSGCVFVNDVTRLLVASGTIFGEVIFWTCWRSEKTAEWTFQTKHMFLGHRGSIFGVAISNRIIHDGRTHRLLASCSDDRTVRIWDVSDYEQEVITQEEASDLVKNTGFGADSGEMCHLAMAWGHVSRIWDVAFVSTSSTSNTSDIGLVTRGEDGVCQLWELALDAAFDRSNTKQDYLKAVASDRHHGGKNIWALAMTTQAATDVFTGGADGQIVRRQCVKTGCVEEYSIKIHDIILPTSTKQLTSLRQYLLLPNGYVIAVTDHGDIVQTDSFNVDVWSIVASASNKSGTTICSNQILGLVFYSMSDKISAYDTNEGAHLDISYTLPSHASWLQIVHSHLQDDRHTIYLLVNLHGDFRPLLVCLTYTGTSADAKALTLYMPSEFIVTSASYDATHDLLLCGSRAGALSVFSKLDFETGTATFTTCIRHIHGADTMTSVMSLPAQPREDISSILQILTTGRDGTFNVHEIAVGERGDEDLTIKTVHRARPSLGPYVEGAYIVSNSSGDDSLILYGFRAREFVVWNETCQMQLLKVDCGGAHRNWSYSPLPEGVGAFVWTKTGTFNVHTEPRLNHRTMSRGGHGREIKTMAIRDSKLCSSRSGVVLDRPTLLATGAEDTEIRLFRWSSTSMSCVGVLKRHKTGLQALKFSSCGQYLFSSGGVEEFFVWRLSEIPVVGVGAVIVGQLPKTEADEDARIMGVDVIDQASAHGIIIVLAYSNGKAKVVEFSRNSLDGSDNLRLTQQLHIGTLCLTQTRLLSHGDTSSILLGATDGFLRLSDLDTKNDAVESHRVHQSSIAAMIIHEIQSAVFLIATGGDDNALGLTLLHKKQDQTIFKTTLVPKAHAAALTAAAIVPSESPWQVFVVTAGNDQKVKLWKATYNMDSDLDSGSAVAHSARIDLQRMHEHSIDVADVSDLGVVRYSHGGAGDIEIEVLIVGVGMQYIKLMVDTKTLHL